MKTSESIKQLAPALLKAQREIKDVVKDGLNPHFKSKYATLDSVIGVCKESLNANGIVFAQGGEETNGELLVLYTRLMHESGEWIESRLAMKPVKADPQGIGSCITYARRYALSAICGVASEDDDDGNAASAPASPKKATASEPAPAPAHDERTALMGRIAVSKARKGAKVLSPESWDSLLSKAFDTSDRAEIANMTPMSLKAGIDKLNALIDELEGI